MGEHEPNRPVTMSAARLEAFSDAVMAVIITLLAFQLRPPNGPTWASFKEVRGDYFIYVLAFAFIAIYWNNHHHLLRATTRISGPVMWANMLLLFCLSLIPVLTGWLKAFPLEAQPVATFGMVALAAGFAYLLLVRSLIRANGPDSLLARAIATDVKGYASLALYAAGVVLAFVDVWIAYALYAAVAVMWLIPDRRFTRATRED
jgi:TMEM175 potassium channel family protein